MAKRVVIVGVDVGGTFTDLFMLDAASGTFRTAKVPSHRGAESKGFLNGLNSLGAAAEMDSIVHGTTVGTNTLLGAARAEDRRHHHARLSRYA